MKEGEKTKNPKKSHTHEASRVGDIGAHLSIDFDESLVRSSENLKSTSRKPLHDDALDFFVCQGVLESVADKDNQRQALATFVRARRRLWRPRARQLVQHPVVWRC